MSIHSGEFTYGLSGEHNLRQIGPESTGNCIDNPGFMEPTYDGAFSVWDNPMKGSNLKPWNPTASKKYFIYYLDIIYKNFNDFIDFISSFSCFVFIIILTSFVLLISPTKNYLLKRKNILFLFLTFILFPLAYLLSRVEARYIRIIHVLILLLGFYFLQTIFKRHNPCRFVKGILVLTLMISFILYPLLFFYDSYDTYQNKISVANQIEPYHLNGNIATNNLSKFMLLSFFIEY
jgi:hypothetical protein